MRASLDSLTRGAAALRAHIGCIQSEWRLIATPVSDPPASELESIVVAIRTAIGTGAAKRRFDYNSIIISLYGLLEQFVEEIIRGYATALQIHAAHYSDLPEALRKAHTELSIELLGKLDHPRYRLLTVERVTAALHSCLSHASPYSLNLEALHQHSSNFRAMMIHQTCGRVGVQSVLDRVPRLEPMATLLSELHGDRDVASMRHEELFFVLNDLADRRNEVAHGAASELLANETLLDYLTFVERFCESLFAVFESDAYAFAAKRAGVPLGTPIVVYNNSVICIEVRDSTIRVGDTLIVETGRTDCPFVGGAILELQVDNKQVEEVVSTAPVPVGCRVPFRTKATYPVFLLPRAAS